MAGEYVEFHNNAQPALNETNVNLMQQLIKQDIQGAVSGDTLPVGAIMPFGSDTIPENWLLCNGQAVSRTDYQQLFNTIGTTFGQGDGFTTFNLPNIQGKVVVGKDENDTDFDMIGKTSGAKEHTLTIDEIPSHNHHIAVRNNSQTGLYETKATNATGETGDAITGNTGGGQSFNIMNPNIVGNYIIKAKQSSGVVATVVDSLNSTSQIDALSANQGKVLNEKIIGTVLFDNASGSQADVNLSDSAANYDFIDVIYGKSASAGFSSVTIYEPNNKTVVLTSTSGTTNNSITIYNSTFLINGNRLVVQNGKSIAFSNTGDVQGFAISAELKIYKVVGYKF